MTDDSARAPSKNEIEAVNTKSIQTKRYEFHETRTIELARIKGGGNVVIHCPRHTSETETLKKIKKYLTHYCMHDLSI